VICDNLRVSLFLLVEIAFARNRRRSDAIQRSVAGGLSNYHPIYQGCIQIHHFDKISFLRRYS
jgi:hypothetical protein